MYDQPKWRLTGYYGIPDRSKRRESWDHLRLLASSSTLPWVVLAVIPRQTKRRFRFENIWLHEDDCKKVICSSWDKSVGEPLLNRIKGCGEDLLRWGGSGLRKLNVKSLLQDGCRYRVESGTSARIWRDPWLPNPNHGFVTSDPLPGHEEATVNQLFVPGENRWDYDILVDLFSEEERGQILKIPLSSYGRSDRIYWVHDNKGFYSVRSGYKRLMQEFFQEYPNTMDSFWRTIWNLKIPAKVRNFLWRASQLVLPTADHLRAKRVDIDKLCPFIAQTSNPLDTANFESQKAIKNHHFYRGLVAV
ncbi:unnamed protein product [Fraxinus pennsylvanica]|uniref:Reverse transcriptase zinc-binding domain-containing protein n=1 Tax=Fraxinus pennsylvanica TaxID=56036 RepID=A0AAD2DLY2_9LAMI|nr:unnamed protein product [Fraxinus pennsylvanica]